MVLCIDADSELVKDEGGEESFFGVDGKPSAAVQAVFGFLATAENNRALTTVAVQALAEAGVIVPWDLQVPEQEGPVRVRGLYRVDMGLLQRTDDGVFLELRKAGALILAYAQVFSMNLVPLLSRLATLQKQLKTQSAAQTRLPDTLDTIFGMNEGSTLKF
jgi:hypothetical protein